MNREKIIADAKRIFPDLSEVSENVYKGELRIEEKPAGIYFIDLHGNLKKETFKDFQEEVLADEYYNQSKELQWNLYFVVIADQIDADDKQFIESDEKYARKYVFNESEFFDFFKVDKVSAPVQSDIVSDWKKQLETADLQEVYGDDTIVAGVDRFLNNKIQKVPAASSSAAATESIRLDFLNTLTLSPSFRPYPLVRQFDFGIVNLFKGVNGVGKTSTLEAIELVACGRTNRNPDNPETDGCVTAIINHKFDAIESCTPSKIPKYKSRDQFWYQNSNTKSNDVYRSFNRFNFFDSDAANNFSLSNNEEKISEALENLILGVEFKQLKARVRSYLGKLKPERNSLKKEFGDTVEKIKEADKILAEQNKDSSVGMLSKDLTDKLASLRLLQPPITNNDNLAPIELLLNQVRTIAERIKGSSAKITKNELSVTEAIRSVSKKIEAFALFRQQLSEIGKSIIDKENAIKELDAKIVVFESVVMILSNPRLLSLEGLKDGMKIATVNNRKIRLVEDKLLPIGYQSISSSDTIEEYFSQCSVSIATIKQEIARISASINSKLQLLQSIERLVREVKDKGKEILLADPAIEDCPLCNTHLGNDELTNRMNSIMNSMTSGEGDSNTGLLVENRVEKEKELGRVELLLRYAQILKENYELIFDRDAAKISMSQCVDDITAFYSRKAEFEKALTDWESIQNYGASLSVTEELLNEIKTAFNLVAADKFVFAEVDRKRIEEQLSLLKETKTTEVGKLESLSASRSGAAQAIKLQLELPVDQPVLPKDVDLALQAELSELNSLEQFYGQLASLLTNNINEIIDDLSSRIDAADKSLSSLKIAVASDQLLAKAKKERSEGEKWIKENDLKLKRLEAGVGLLEELEEKGGSDELAGFFDANFVQIIDVFKTIHTPREFDDMKYNNGKIKLIDTSGAERSVSQISTGQRAALALSIFISMNRMLKNGPRIIIFDDPISHVDDLNALSFLDYLRLFILKEKRQIFFASANSRLVSLFEKKFCFLGQENFKQWELRR